MSLGTSMLLELRALAAEMVNAAAPETFPTLASALLEIPGLRGAWLPGCSVDNTGYVSDLTGQGRRLTTSGSNLVTLQGSRVPCIHFNGSSCLYRADEANLDLSGTEAIVFSTWRGWTVGAWARFDAAGAGNEYILAKRGAASNTCNYAIRRIVTEEIETEVSDGLGTDTKRSTAKLGAGAWGLVVARFDPGTELAIFLNGTLYTKTTSVVSGTNNALQFQLGGRDSGAGGTAENMTGHIAAAFISAMAIPDVRIEAFWNRTRALFRV